MKKVMEYLEEWERKRNELIDLARELSWRNFGKRIFFFTPSFAPHENGVGGTDVFPSISITGEFCSLNCDHCGGILLRTMKPALSPSDLISICEELKRKGAVGCLISGGCMPDGSVPLRRFLNAIREVKKKIGLKVIIHTGIIDPATAKELGAIGIDAALIDVIGSEETLRKIYHIDANVERYHSTLKAIKSSNIPLVPHILIGLHYGMLKGEFKALEIISNYDPSALVLIIFTPIRGTRMASIQPPNPYDVTKVIVTARLLMPHIPITLGCMRPKRNLRSRIDTLAVKAGINGIAYPTTEAVNLSRELGLEILYSPLCCSQIFEAFQK